MLLRLYWRNISTLLKWQRRYKAIPRSGLGGLAVILPPQPPPRSRRNLVKIDAFSSDEEEAAYTAYADNDERTDRARERYVTLEGRKEGRDGARRIL